MLHAGGIGDGLKEHLEARRVADHKIAQINDLLPWRCAAAAA